MTRRMRSSGVNNKDVKEWILGMIYVVCMRCV
jgi:hypothetical protein